MLMIFIESFERRNDLDSAFNPLLDPLNHLFLVCTKKANIYINLVPQHKNIRTIVIFS